MNRAPAAELKTDLAVLVSRLDRGLDKIAAAKDEGQSTSKLETFWIGLLREYEHKYDQLQALGG